MAKSKAKSSCPDVMDNYDFKPQSPGKFTDEQHQSTSRAKDVHGMTSKHGQGDRNEAIINFDQNQTLCGPLSL